MIYLALALIIYFTGKVFFKAIPEDFSNPKNCKDLDEYQGQAVMTGIVRGLIVIASALVLGYIGFLAWKNLTRTERKVTLTVLERHDGDKGNNYYLRLSDGATLRFYPSGFEHNDYNKWLTVQKGHRIQKVIYNNKEPEYSPVFDE